MSSTSKAEDDDDEFFSAGSHQSPQHDLETGAVQVMQDDSAMPGENADEVDQQLDESEQEVVVEDQEAPKEIIIVKPLEAIANYREPTDDDYAAFSFQTFAPLVSSSVPVNAEPYAEADDEFESFAVAAPTQNVVVAADAEDEFAGFSVAGAPSHEAADDDGGFGDFSETIEAAKVPAVVDDGSVKLPSLQMYKSIMAGDQSGAQLQELVKQHLLGFLSATDSHGPFKLDGNELDTTQLHNILAQYIAVATTGSERIVDAKDVKRKFVWKDSMIRKMALISLGIPTNVIDADENLHSTVQTLGDSQPKLEAGPVNNDSWSKRVQSISGATGTAGTRTGTSSTSQVTPSTSMQNLRDLMDAQVFSDQVKDDQVAMTVMSNNDLYGSVQLPMIDSRRMRELGAMTAEQLDATSTVSLVLLREEVASMCRDLNLVARHLEVGKQTYRQSIKDHNATIERLAKDLQSQRAQSPARAR